MNTGLGGKRYTSSRSVRNRRTPTPVGAKIGDLGGPGEETVRAKPGAACQEDGSSLDAVVVQLPGKTPVHDQEIGRELHRPTAQRGKP